MTRYKIVSLLIFAVLCLQGCANQSDQQRELAENSAFKIVQVNAGDSYASLAQEFLGNASYASVIERYNPDLLLSASPYIAIPKQVINRSAVFSNGYQLIPILCYHQFTKENKGRTRMEVPETEFRAQMKYLHDNGYTVVTLADVGLFIRGNKELPDKSVVITIDDGYKSYMDIAWPILQEYGFASTMFVYPEFVGAGIALKWQDVKKLNRQALIDIQSHSKTHDSLSRRPGGESDDDYLKRLKFEVVDAEHIISKRIDHVINQFAYPYGNTSPMLIELLQANEYDLAVTVERGSNPAFSAPFLLNRTMIYGGDSLDTFIRSLDTYAQMDLK